MAALERQRKRRARMRPRHHPRRGGRRRGGRLLPGEARAKAKVTLTAQQIADNAAVKGGCSSNPAAVLKKPSWKTPPAMTIDTAKTYTATVKTDVGTFVITLDAKHAPMTVNNFVFLARLHFYNGIIFHRVIPGFMDQGGDPTGTGSGGPGLQVHRRAARQATPQYPPGRWPWPTAAPNTNGSQFFIVVAAGGSSLTPSYTLFGQVTSGMAVVNKINADGNRVRHPAKVIHRILTVTIRHRVLTRDGPTATVDPDEEDLTMTTDCPAADGSARSTQTSTGPRRCASTPPSATPPRWSPPRGR